jgi:hypothetical protein
MKEINSLDFEQFLKDVTEMRRLQISHQMFPANQTDTWIRTIEQRVDKFI